MPNWRRSRKEDDERRIAVNAATSIERARKDLAGPETMKEERQMTTSRYGDDRFSARDRAYDDYWERRWARVMRSRDGFAWGAFFIGVIAGAIIF